MTIEANDSPNGFVSLGSPEIVTTENDFNSLIMIPVLRRLENICVRYIILFYVYFLLYFQCWTVS